MSAKTHKLYCYVDETGQDAGSNFFIVSIIVTDNQQIELEAKLEKIEQSSGKRLLKWIKTKDQLRKDYINAIINDSSLPMLIYVVSTEGESQIYTVQEVMATAQAIYAYREENNIDEKDYKATITVDGLSKSVALRMGSSLRKLGIQTRKVIGLRDESSAIIRLADAIAGLAREAYEGKSDYKALEKKLEKSNKLHKL